MYTKNAKGNVRHKICPQKMQNDMSATRYVRKNTERSVRHIFIVALTGLQYGYLRPICLVHRRPAIRVSYRIIHLSVRDDTLVARA